VALQIPSAVEAQEPSELVIDEAVEFDFNSLVFGELAEIPSDPQETGTDIQPVTVTPGESASAEDGSLAKAAQNPIASLISLPIQWNSTPSSQWAPNVVDSNAKHNQTQTVVNVQPVVPFKVNKELTLVTRTIVPFISQPFSGSTSIQGLGDINPSVFFVPTLKGNFTVGVGPTVIIPSATDSRLSSGRWSGGPTGVLVYSKGKVVAGGLVNNVWSFAGGGKKDVNKMLFQPFLNYNLPKGWYLSSSPIVTVNWMSEGNKGWMVPVGAGVGRVFRLGSQPVNASLSAYYNLVKPEIAGEVLAGDWTLRFQFQFLFPAGG
tara:strand:+ start:801 stop:1757 length:957 start_codon:yes stop_codon:yes gene_type:complete